MTDICKNIKNFAEDLQKQGESYIEGYFAKQYINRKNNLTIISTNNFEKSENFSKGELEDLKYIRKRSDGRWQYSKTINYERVYVYAKTKEELLIKIKKLKPTKPIKKKEITLYEWSKNYFDTFKINKKALSEKTIEEYKNLIDNHIKNYFDNKSINKISILDLQKFLNSRPKRIAQKLFQFLSSVLKKAHLLKIIKEDLSEGIEKPIFEKSEEKMPLTINEQKQFLEVLKRSDPIIRKFCLFCLVLGTRRNEALDFIPEDINREKNTILIKGTKTKNAWRTIRISNSMIDLLLDETVPNQKVFNMNEKTIYKQVVKHLNLAGIKEKSTHNLRHTCATNLYYLGMPDKHRQHQLGHASIVTTNDIYTHIELDVKREDIIKLYQNLYYEF